MLGGEGSGTVSGAAEDSAGRMEEKGAPGPASEPGWLANCKPQGLRAGIREGVDPGRRWICLMVGADNI